MSPCRVVRVCKKNADAFDDFTPARHSLVVSTVCQSLTYEVDLKWIANARVFAEADQSIYSILDVSTIFSQEAVTKLLESSALRTSPTGVSRSSE
jgi:hypothetical protein